MGKHDDLITPENLSAEQIKAVFDAAYMDVKLDEDGDVFVANEVGVSLLVAREAKNRIRFLAFYGFNKDSVPSARLECANQINANFVMVCASAEGDNLVFRYDLMVNGGVTKKALVLAVKDFSTIVPLAINDYGKDIVE